jgi:predicted Zn-dependent protease with MMP-like domain
MCDVRPGRLMSKHLQHLRRLALQEVEATLAALPPPLRQEAVRLPITFEPRPSPALQADGIEPDTLGLFVGPEFAEESQVPMPPQIILFLENLWDFSEGDEKIFLGEVHTTLLHELGHFLGLDETDLCDRGLE